MGGELWVRVHPHHSITAETWTKAMAKLDAHVEENKCEQTEHGPDIAYQYHTFLVVRRQWSGPKDSITTNMSGRRNRSNEAFPMLYQIIRVLQEAFPGQIALVVCDGFANNDEYDFYLDGCFLCAKGGAHRLKWNKWPWANDCDASFDATF